MHSPNANVLNSNNSDATVSPTLQGSFAAVAAPVRTHVPTPVRKGDYLSVTLDVRLHQIGLQEHEHSL